MFWDYSSFKNYLVLFSVVLFAITPMTPLEVLQKIGSPDVFFLDVRENIEYEAGHIPGSILMPWNSGILQKQWNQLPKDKLIIVYCASGGRSAAASQFLVGQGWENIANMTGGFSSYRSLPNALIATGPYQEPSTPVADWFLY